MIRCFDAAGAGDVPADQHPADLVRVAGLALALDLCARDSGRTKVLTLSASVVITGGRAALRARR